MPTIIITPILSTIIVYFGIGLTISAGKFFMFAFILFLVCFIAVAIGTFISSLFKRAETAVLMVPVIIMPLMILGGFFANSDGVPHWIRWAQYVSPIRYLFEALAINEFKNLTLAPGVPNLLDVLNFNLGYAICLPVIVVMSVLIRILAYLCLKFLITKF